MQTGRFGCPSTYTRRACMDVFSLPGRGHLPDGGRPRDPQVLPRAAHRPEGAPGDPRGRTQDLARRRAAVGDGRVGGGDAAQVVQAGGKGYAAV